MKTYRGLVIALSILFSWLLLLIYLLRLDWTEAPLLALGGFVLQTFLYTGLFITAHDAMHGTIVPFKPSWNTWLGSVSVFFYAFMWYPYLKDQHQYHHRYPASGQDPDYHSEDKPGFFAWYLKFLLHYIRWWQVLGIAIVFNILHHVVGIPLGNLLLFWVVPSILSTFQLFYFGTFLPHRETAEAFPDQHRANSLNFGVFWSFLSCYHFGGYHHEHHLYPGTPWWLLPQKAPQAKNKR